jgi:hypothetical protein
MCSGFEPRSAQSRGCRGGTRITPRSPQSGRIERVLYCLNKDRSMASAIVTRTQRFGLSSLQSGWSLKRGDHSHERLQPSIIAEHRSFGHSRSPWNKDKIIGSGRHCDRGMSGLFGPSCTLSCAHATWPSSTWRSTANCADAISWHCASMTWHRKATQSTAPTCARVNRSAGAVRIDRADARVSRRVSAQQWSEAGAGSVSTSRRPRSISDDAAVRAPGGAMGCQRRS